MLTELAPPAVANAKREGAATAGDDRQGAGGQGRPSSSSQPWDWAYYTEKVRKAKYDFDESQLKPVLRAEQRAAERRVLRRQPALRPHASRSAHDLPVYNPDVRVFDVFDADGKQLAIFSGRHVRAPDQAAAARG